MEKLVWEDKSPKLLSHVSFGGIIFGSLIILIGAIIWMVLYGFSLVLSYVIIALYLAYILLILFILYLQIKSYSNKVKVYSDGILLKTNKSWLMRAFQIGLKEVFLDFSDIDKISVAPIYSEIGLFSKGGFSLSGGQSLIIYKKDKEEYVCWLLDKEGFQEALKKVKFSRVKFSMIPQIVL
jgi:hypothetical protein